MPSDFKNKENVVSDGENDLYEPVIFNGNPAWLKVTHEKEIINSGDSVKEILRKDHQTEYNIKTSFEVKPEGLWQCLKCGAFIQYDEYPPECFKEQGGCGRATQFKPILGLINPDLWTLPEWKDISEEKLNKKKIYEEMLALIKDLIVFSTDIEYKIYTLWIISTWKLESWDTVGFPIFIGIPNSGKSRALKIISQLGYRSPKTSNITASAIPRITHFYNATILIDEAHNKLNPKTESGSQLLDFIKDSYKQGSVYVSCDNNDQSKVKVTRNFGFKAIAGEKTFNTGLLSRAITFYMDKADPKIAKLSYVQEEFKQLRTKLLNYRFKTNSPPDLGNTFTLKGRSREIFESIISTAKHIGLVTDDIIKYAKQREQREEDELQDSVQADILLTIKNNWENPALSDSPEYMRISEIAIDLNWNENIKKGSQTVGYYLKSMGLQTKRKSGGTCLVYADNEERLKKLFRRYKLEGMQTFL